MPSLRVAPFRNARRACKGRRIQKAEAVTSAFAALAWLPHLDSNQDKENQNLLCYRYTMRQFV